MEPISRAPWMIQPSRTNGRKENLDRFIPNRSATKFDFVMTKGWKRSLDPDSISPTKEAYLGRLRKVFNLEDERIFAYKNKPPAPVELFPKDNYALVRPPKPVKPRRHIPKTADQILDAPNLTDDYYVNLLDWGSNDVLAIALENTVHLWNAKNKTASELITVDNDVGPVTSVSWAPDGSHIAVGLDNSHVQLWDSTTNKLLRTFKGEHQACSLAWNRHILTSGSMDSSIINNDVRVRNHVIETYQGHRGQICGLKWSQSGQQLASGGNDNLVFIWDQSYSLASRGSTQWLHKLEDHRAAVRALAWCPFQSNLLATGGGGADGCIKFWNSHTGACLNSVDTGSQVCSLQWSKNNRELLSSHGVSQKQLSLWKYPSMVRMAELSGHDSRVLFTARSPDGCTVASAGGESLRFWKVFGAPEAAKATERDALDPFSHFSRIR